MAEMTGPAVPSPAQPSPPQHHPVRHAVRRVVYYLLPCYVMVMTSLKGCPNPDGNIFSPPLEITFEPW